MKRTSKVPKVLILLVVHMLIFGITATNSHSGEMDYDFNSTEDFRRAAQEGNAEAVKLFIKANMDVNSHNEYGLTALLAATRFRHADIARLLIENGADVNVGADDGDTPLIFAANGNMVDIARLLIEHGADVNAKTTWGESALIVAQKKGHMNIVKLLKEAGAKE